MQNKVQLIVDASRFSGSVSRLANVLRTRFNGVYEGIHLLPVSPAAFPSTIGAASADSFADNPYGGSSADIRQLSQNYEVMADVPISADVLFKKMKQAASGHSGKAVPSVPAFFDHLAAMGAKDVFLPIARLTDENTDNHHSLYSMFLEWLGHLTREVHQRGMSLVAGVHSFYLRQARLAEKVDKVVDYSLPALLLHTLTTGNAAPLAAWLKVRPAVPVSVLDAREGISLRDVAKDPADPNAKGLLSDTAIDKLIRSLDRHTRGESTQATGTVAAGSIPSWVMSSYYSALGCDDTKYLAARAVQFFLPGVPQVYAMGAMMAPNDMDLFRKTGRGSDVNQHYFTDSEISANLLRPEVKALNALCRFRNSLEAFNGDFSYGYDKTYGVLSLLWHGKKTSARLDFDPQVIADRGEMGQSGLDAENDISWRSVATITWTDATGEHKTNNLLTRPPVASTVNG